MIKVTIAEHIVAAPTKTLASLGGKHIYNIHLTEDVDNGLFVGKGAFEELDLYTEAAPTSFSGTVVGVAADGNYYVEVASAENALFVYTAPVIEENFTSAFAAEKNFYNASGDVARAYELAEGDVIEISAAGFSATPKVGDTVELKAVTGKTAKQLGKTA